MKSVRSVLPVISSYQSKAQQGAEALRAAHEVAEGRYEQARKSGEAFNEHSPLFRRVMETSNAVREASDYSKKLEINKESAKKMMSELESVKDKFGIVSRELTKDQAAKTVVELQIVKTCAENLPEVPDKGIKAAYTKIGEHMEAIQEALTKKYGLTKKDIAKF